LQAAHHDRGQFAPFERQAAVDGTEELDELFVDDFDEFFVGFKAQQDPAAFCSGCDVFNEGTDDIDADVGFDQGSLDHGDPLPHIRFGQLTFTLEGLKGAQ